MWLMSEGKKKLATGWALSINWQYEDGTWRNELLSELPNSVAQAIDDFITELEEDYNEQTLQ